MLTLLLRIQFLVDRATAAGLLVLTNEDRHGWPLGAQQKQNRNSSSLPLGEKVYMDLRCSGSGIRGKFISTLELLRYHQVALACGLMERRLKDNAPN